MEVLLELRVAELMHHMNIELAVADGAKNVVRQLNGCKIQDRRVLAEVSSGHRWVPAQFLLSADVLRPSGSGAGGGVVPEGGPAASVPRETSERAGGGPSQTGRRHRGTRRRGVAFLRHAQEALRRPVLCLLLQTGSAHRCWFCWFHSTDAEITQWISGG